MSREAFGPTLRRSRLRKGVSLEQISTESNVPVELFAGLEQNDLSGWPFGIYARAYVRQYACAVGLDPEETVNEFCRYFPQGDRRVLPTVHEYAAIIGHPTTWQDELPQGLEGADRRSSGEAPVEPPPRQAPSTLHLMLTRLRRTFGRA